MDKKIVFVDRCQRQERYNAMRETDRATSGPIFSDPGASDAAAYIYSMDAAHVVVRSRRVISTAIEWSGENTI
jgi:hypothetical protein